MTPTTEPPLRLIELLGSLSLAADLAAGVPIETSVRTCVLATTIGARLGLRGEALRTVHAAALLRHIGCTAWSHEAARLAGGDDHLFLRTFHGVEPRERIGRAVRRLPAMAVARSLLRPGAARDLAAAQCAQAMALTSDLGMPRDVQQTLLQMYERFDGSGAPNGSAGADISLAARILHVAEVVEIHARTFELEAAVALARERAGKHLDPEVVRAADVEPHVLREPFERCLALEPTPHATVSGRRMDDVAIAFGRYVDLKFPSRIGHAARVASIVEQATSSDDSVDAKTLIRAAHLHDLGLVTVPSGMLEDEGSLSSGARETVRLHAYHTERILQRCPALGAIAAIAGAHHERLDGSGYHRASSRGSVSRAARLLAAADVYAAVSQARPHRPAHPDPARVLRDEARAGRLCEVAVDAVLGTKPKRRAYAHRLTEREVEVLGHLARGSTNKEIAAALGIRERTVKHHLEHVFAKIGATTRAAAALFAARHDLLDG